MTGLFNKDFCLQHRANSAQGLADAAQVFYKRKTYMIIAILAKTDPGRNRHLSLYHQLFGELQRTQMLVLSGIFAQTYMVALGCSTIQPMARNPETSTSRRAW